MKIFIETHSLSNLISIPEWKVLATFVEFGKSLTLLQSSVSSPSLVKLFNDLASQKKSVAFFNTNLDFGDLEAVFFDFDSTFIAQETVVELAQEAGCMPQVEQLTEAAMRGEIDFEGALRKRVSLLKGLKLARVLSVNSRLTLNPGIENLVSELKSRGIKVFIISGGFNLLVEPKARSLGITNSKAHELEFVDDTLTGKIRGPIIDAKHKAEWVSEQCLRFKCSISKSIVIGDGANDIPMLQLQTMLSVGFAPKSVLLPHIQCAIWGDSYDFLSALLFAKKIKDSF